MGKVNLVGVIACLCVLSGTSLANSGECNSTPTGTKCLNATEGGSAQVRAQNEAAVTTKFTLQSPASVDLSETPTQTFLKPSNSPQIASGSENSAQVHTSGGNSSSAQPLVPADPKTPPPTETTTSHDTSTTVPSPTTPATETPTSKPTPKPITTPATTTTSATTTSIATSVTPPTVPSTPQTSTVSPSSPSPSTAPTPTTPTKAPTSTPESDRRFDGPSFIGGIVFALGVTAIGFIAWKFYKARTERNYHTL